MSAWKHISEIHKDGIKYMEHRRDGIIKSIKTPWPKFDEAGLDGLEWGTIVTLAGRPGSGKTSIVNQITRNAHVNNPGHDFAVLDFQFEMSSKSTAVREFSNLVGLDYKDLLSVHGKVTDYTLNTLKAHAAKSINTDIYQVDTPMTVLGIRKTVMDFYKFVGKPVLVTIDHSVLVKKDTSEKDKYEMLYNLGEMLTELKKLIPVTFIILTQMNRSIEDPLRKVPGTIGNYPVTSDVFGADALYQHSDMLIAINNPFTHNLLCYGPQEFMVEKHHIAMHFLKVRNGEPVMTFFDSNLQYYTIKQSKTIPMTKFQFNQARSASSAPKKISTNPIFNP